MKRICQNEEFFRYSKIITFHFEVDKLTEINDLYYELSKKYKKNSHFTINADAYTLYDYKLPVNGQYRTFGYGEVGELSENIRNVELRIVQLSHTLFFGIMIAKYSKLFIDQYNEVSRRGPYERLTKKIWKELGYKRNSLNALKRKIPVNYNSSDRLDKKVDDEIEEKLIQLFRKYSFCHTINVFAVKPNRCAESEEFWKDNYLKSNSYYKTKINDEKCIIYTPIYNTKMKTILMHSNILRTKYYSLNQSVFPIFANSILFLSIYSVLEEIDQYIDSNIEKSTKVDLLKKSIVKLDVYECYLNNLLKTNCLKKETFKINNDKKVLGNTINELKDSIKIKKTTLDSYSSFHEARYLKSINKAVLIFSVIAILISLSALLRDVFNIVFPILKEKSTNIFIWVFGSK